ncbi:MAG TPA: methionine--tRNA ligase [Kofleriaceae bacterium]|nr:methionine--tRNA ligase [Kofleriaceae bacterium]
MTRPFYITTPIYYVNDVPHLGHAYATMAADTFARFHRLIGDDTRFLTGTDEHGQKVEEAAKKRGLTPKQLVDDVAPRFAAMWESLGISNDDFVRTTETRHKDVVRALWKRIAERNRDDLYLATYQGWYCVGCEAFYTESQLTKQGDTWICPIHTTPVSWVDKERSWFFRLSAYKTRLIDHIEAHPDFIQPDAYRKEVLSFLRGEVRDLSVSRTSFDWGIDVPEGDPEGKHHVIYVWMDALTNYLSALGMGTPLYDRFWGQAVHLIGKDILRFHAVYWPCFLMAAELPLPKKILCTGWWTIGGRKISKSIPATRVDPLVLAADLNADRALGIDALRYFLLRETPLGNDGDLIYESLIERHNADLANDLGNLVNRSLTMITKFAGQAPPVHSDALADVANQVIAEAKANWEAFQPSRALEATWRLIREGNRFVDSSQPWALAKAGKNDELARALGTLQTALWTIRNLIAAVMPTTAIKIGELLGVKAEPAWPTAWGADLPAFHPQPPTPLFPRIDDKRTAELLAKWLPAETAAAPVAEKKEAALITFEDFSKAELRVAQVITAAPVPKAKKLLQLTVDVGEGRHRTVVAGIAEAYQPEQLVGRKVLLVANLAPATIRGVQSEGMILAAGDDSILGLAAVDSLGPDVPVGTRVR